RRRPAQGIPALASTQAAPGCPAPRAVAARGAGAIGGVVSFCGKLPMFNALFRDHPAEVGGSYSEHLAAATGFGAKMVAGGLACMVHAVIPGLFVTTGSGTVRRLYEAMVAK